jgi:segregation and condensation protein A
MSYEVKTPVFEGPLDLLLQLITSHRLQVTDLSLTELVSEYLGYLEVIKTLDLEVTSEFLVIAATLVQLKARSLLPDGSDIDIDDDLLLSEERDRLLSRLLANLTFKDVAAVLAARLETTTLLLPRLAGFDFEVAAPEVEVRVPIDASGLAELAERVLNRASAAPDLDHLDLDLPSVSDAIADLRRRIDAEVETDFARLTSHLTRPIEVVAYFLAILELARWGLVEARQEHIDSAITVKRTGDPNNQLVSEWDAEGQS